MILQPTPKFLKDIKALQKKYPSVPNDIQKFAEKLQSNPRDGES